MTCTKEGNEWELTGNSGTTFVEDNPQSIQAENTAFSGVAHSAWHEINCTGLGEPAELYVFWYDRGVREYDVTLKDGEKVGLTAELTLKANTAEEEVHEMNILERKVVLEKDLDIEIATGDKIGESLVIIECKYNGSNFDLHGAHDVSKNQSVFNVIGKHTVYTSTVSKPVTITCEQEEGE